MAILPRLQPQPTQPDPLGMFLNGGAAQPPNAAASAALLKNNGSQSAQQQRFVDDTIENSRDGSQSGREGLDVLDHFLSGQQARLSHDPTATRYDDIAKKQTGALAYNDPLVHDQREDERKFDLEKVGEPARVTGEYGIKRDTITSQADIEKQRIASQGLVGAAEATHGAGGHPLASGLMERVAGGSSALQLIQNLRDQRKNVSIGPAAGRTQSFLQGMPLIPADANFAKFKADSTILTNATIKAITGAQMSEPEAKRLMGQIPNENDKDVVWDAKANAMEDITRGLNIRIGLLNRGIPADILDQIPVELLAQRPEMLDRITSGGGLNQPVGGDDEWETVSQ